MHYLIAQSVRKDMMSSGIMLTMRSCSIHHCFERSIAFLNNLLHATVMSRTCNTTFLLKRHHYHLTRTLTCWTRYLLAQSARKENLSSGLKLIMRSCSISHCFGTSIAFLSNLLPARMMSKKCKKLLMYLFLRFLRLAKPHLLAIVR